MQRIVTTLVVLVAATVSGAAGVELPHGKWWENERVARRIGLTEDQQRAIGELVYQHALRMIDLNAAVKKAEFELADLVDREDFDPAAVRKAFAAFQVARQSLENERFEMLLAVRESLSASQWRELLEIRRQLERLRDGRRPGEAAPGRPSGPPAEAGRQPTGGVWR